MNETEAQRRDRRAAEMRADAEASFFFFARVILGLDRLNDYHKGLCDWMQSGASRRQMILWPRGTYKSTISMAYALWLVILNPEHRVLFASSTVDVAKKRLKVLKSWMENNPLLSGLWPEIFWANPQAESPAWSEKGATVKRKGTWTEETFEVGGIDVNIVGKHFTIGVLDDLVDRDNVDTPRGLEKTIDYFQMLRPIYIPGGVDGKGFIEVLDGTRWNDGDLYGWVLENDKKVSTNIRGIWANDEETETILGADFPVETLASIRETMTAYQFSCQYLNTPIGSETAMFKESDIAPLMYDTLPAGQYATTVTMDPAKKAAAGNDFTAMTARCLSTDGHWYVDGWNEGRWLLKDRAKELFHFCVGIENRGHRILAVGVEDPDGLDIPAFKDEMERNRKWWTVHEIKHRGRTKKSRVEGIQAVSEHGRLHIRKSFKKLAMDLYRFPYAKFDDGPDSLAMHRDLPIGSPSNLKPVIPFNSPDAIADRVAARTRGDRERQPVGYAFQPKFSQVEESWFA